MELRIQLQPKQRMFCDEIEKTPVTLFGGAKGGGKSHGLRSIMLLRRFKHSNTAGAIFRKTYPELYGNHIRPLFNLFPQLRSFYNESKKILTLPNGSTLEFCYARNEKDLDNYQGREFQDLAIDEVGQWTEAMFTKLRGSNRSSIPGVKPRTYLTANPGGIGHQWLKRIFIDRKFDKRERSEDYSFIQSLVDDNKALIDNDPEYVHRLEAEKSEVLRRAYRYGDWDLLAGQYFSELRRDIHLIKPFDIPEHWNRFGGYDYGFSHPASFGWYAVDEDGNVYKYRELVKARMRVDQFAKEVNKFPDTEKLYPIVAGHDCWAKRNATINKDQGEPPSIAEEFAKHGIRMKPAVIDRINGATQLRNYLAWEGKPNNKPKFFIFDTCQITFDCLSRMINDPDRIEDVLKVDAEEGDPFTGDDAYDETRYSLMSRPILTDKIEKHEEPGTKEWADKEEKKILEQQEKEFNKKEKEWWETV